MTITKHHNTPLQRAFDYLRTEAIDAHLAGDGMRVLHLCASALERIGVRPNETAEQIDVGDVRWAFFLGLYWMVDDWLTHVIEDALKYVVTDEISAWDSKLARFLLTTAHIPVNFESVDELRTAPPEWIRERSQNIEDLAALGLAVEIAWYEDPRNPAWKELPDGWLAHCPKPSALEKDLQRLVTRLEAQAMFCSEGRLPGSDETVFAVSREQDLLLQAWKLYYEADFVELDKLITRISSLVEVDSPVLPALFHVVHWSRIGRRSKESQFTSLSRRNYLKSRQPAQTCQQLRDERFESSFAEIARRGFPDGVASERFTCFRMAMLNQLHALRAWDIGGWLLGEQQRAFCLLELGARGDLACAKAGVIARRNSLYFPERGKYPHLDRSVQLLDFLPEDGRRAIVKDLLASPRIAWVAAHRVFEELSDAIPVDMLGEIAAWYVRLDLDPFHSHGKHTRLEMWGSLLNQADRAAELVEVLKPALLAKAAWPTCWDDLHGTLCSAIVKAGEDTAISILEKLLDASCGDVHWNEYRFSILYNIVRLRPEFSERCLQWLEEYAETRQDQRSQFRLRLIHAPDETPVDDKAFRDWVRQSVLATCEERLSEHGPNYHFGVRAYYSMMFQLTWLRSETRMTRELITVIDTEYVPLINKGDPLACLAVLALRGPESQAKVIIKAAMRWLDRGITGIDIGHTGPLSTGQFLGAGSDAILPGFSFLLRILAEKHCDRVGQRLARWIMVKGVRRPASVVRETIRTALYLSIGMRKADEPLSIALVGIAEAAAHVCFHQNPEGTIQGFRSVVLDGSSSADRDAWLSSSPGKICVQMLEQLLIDTSRLPKPVAREAAAYAIKKWADSKVPVTDGLQEARLRLARDCRYRVRVAVSGGSGN